MGNVNSGFRKYSFDKNVFDDINSASKAYWIGFIGGDGSVNNYSLRIEISEQDIEHLYKFKIFTSYTGEIKKTRKQCNIISLNSKSFVAGMVKHNIYKNKTSTYETPKTIPFCYLSDYYRGILDSDGWITTHTSKHKNSYEIGFSSSNMIFLQQISNYISENSGSTKGYMTHRKKNNQECCQLIFGGNTNFKKIIKLIYDKPGDYLNRKYELVQKALFDLSQRVDGRKHNGKYKL